MTPVRMAKVEEAARIGLAWHAALARADAAALLALLAENCVWESASPAPRGTRLAGRAAIAGYLQTWLHVETQRTWQVEEVTGFGRQCVVYWRQQASAEDYRRGADVFEVRDGLICGIKSYVKG
ncbi:MAG: nuclear transport factor 2 family protein, partial [Caldilineales bacterium]